MNLRNLTYLDISISICGGKYVTEVYDKRDDFNFDIVNIFSFFLCIFKYCSMHMIVHALIYYCLIIACTYFSDNVSHR